MDWRLCTIGIILAPYLRKFGKFTVPDFIGERYYSNTARLVAVFCALAVSFTYVAGQMKGYRNSFLKVFRDSYRIWSYRWDGNSIILCGLRWDEE